jgi:hypothetical protein
MMAGKLDTSKRQTRHLNGINMSNSNNPACAYAWYAATLMTGHLQSQVASYTSDFLGYPRREDPAQID